MLMSFSEIIGLVIFLPINIKLGEVPVSDLIRGSGSENNYVVVVVFVGLLLLQVFLSLLGNNIETEFLVVFVSDPGLWVDFVVVVFDELFGLLYGDV